MSSLIPFLFALLLIKHKNLKEDRNYRFSVLSIVGLIFFCVFRFIDYYFLIFDYADLDQLITKTLVIAITIVFCLSPILVKSSTTKAFFCTTLFALGFIFSFALDRPLKIYIADAAGYFEKTEDAAISNKTNGTFYRDDDGGYSFFIPDSWERRTTKSDLVYFIDLKEGAVVLELRPRCFHDSNLVITEVVKNLKQFDKEENRSSNIQCSGSYPTYNCLIKSAQMGNPATRKKDIPQERWRWLSMNVRTNQNIDIDVLIFNIQKQTIEQVQAVLASITTTPLQHPKPVCLNPIEWF